MYKQFRKIIAIILCLSIILSIGDIEELAGLSWTERILGEVTDEEETEIETTGEEGAEPEVSSEETENEVLSEGETEIETTGEEETENEVSSEEESETETTGEEQSETISWEGQSETSLEETTAINLEETEAETWSQTVERPVYYAGNTQKTTVSATNALNYENYDDINIGVYTHEDWKNLVAITHKSDLKGVDIILSNDSSKPTDKQTWNLTAADLSYTDSTGTYYGLGSEAYPFAGNLVSQFTLTLKPAVTLFNYLSSDAEIGSSVYGITVNYASGNNNITAGLAEHLILQSGDYYWKYIRLSVAGYIGNSNGSSDVVGGLFAHVQKKDENITDAKLIIDSNMSTLSNVTKVYGKIAGGIIGQVEEGVTVEMSDCPVLPSTVQSSETCAGGVIGKLIQGAVLETNAAGDGCIILQHGTAGTVAARVTGNGYTGGLIGWVQNSTVYVSSVKKYDSVRGTQFAGGLIGFVESTDVDSPVHVTVSDFILAAQHISQTGTAGSISFCAGGVIGKYQTDLNDTASTLEICNVTSEGATRENSDTGSNFPRIENANISNQDEYYFNGGIVGGIYGNNVKIQNIEFNTEHYKVNQMWNVYTESNTNQNANGIYTWNTKSTGSIAGSIAGRNIEIDNIVLGLERLTSNTSAYWDTGLSGKTIGGLVGRVGYFNGSNVSGSKIKVSNIKVESFFTWSQKEKSNGDVCGGLFGDVGTGSLIALGGTIDLSGLSKMSKTATTYSDLYGAEGSKGFIAGESAESLIYFEIDASVTRPVTVEDGIVYFGTEITDTTPNSDNTSYRTYTIDDIGNYGSVYRNIVDTDGNPVIVFSNEAGHEVTGAVNTTTLEDGKEYYVIDSLADALRLSIAGHTFQALGDKKPGFGAGCFDDKTIQDILSSNFLIQCDLNLSDAGIHGFLRNNRGDNLAYGFSGTMKGDTKPDGSKYTITMRFISRQYYGGLYPQLFSGVVFDNLAFDGWVCYERPASTGAGGAGILAANSTGSMSVTKVDVTAKLKGYYLTSVWDNNTMYSYGGFVGNVNLGSGTINVDECIISPDISIMHNHFFVGGLFGKVSTAVGSDVSVTNSVIGTTFTANSQFSVGAGGNTNHGRYAGMIGFMGNSYNNVGTTNGNTAFPGAVSNTTYTTVTVEHCVIQDSKLDLTNANSTNMRISGGFLGYAWCNIDAIFNDIKITGDSRIYSRGYVGGLISFVSGKCDVKNIDINSLEMKNVYGSNITYSSFLFGNAQAAYIILDQATYTIHTENDEVKATNYSNFDEIVGINLLVDNCNVLNSGLNTGYSGGGVLNIINSDFKSFKTGDYGSDESYDSYRNRVVASVNRYTRYYYNLFTGDTDDWTIINSGNIATIDSPKKMMTWHVAFYANSYIRRFFTEYYGSNVNYYNISTFNIESDLDMNGYSLYPTNISSKTVNGNGHKIILYGQEISDLEQVLYRDDVSNVYRNNEYMSSNSQHYMMHASLFYNMSGTSKISGVTLSGTAAYNSKFTGALIGGTVMGTAAITDIVADNISIGHYGTNGIDGTGLLIGRIGLTSYGSDTTAYVTIDNMRTINYDDINSPVAASLIGYVGSTSATDVRVYFQNMQVSDERADQVFKYASFIYDYEHTNNIEKNNCYGLYIFNYSDAVDGNVTYGSEIAKKVDYNDCLRSSIPEGQENPLQEAIDRATADSDYYLPYVYKTKNIYVNPQNGNITKGCGTYEDPYIIDNPRQFLSLYCYLTGKTIYYNMLGEKDTTGGTAGNSAWTINKLGGDGDGFQCSEQMDYAADREAHEIVSFTYSGSTVSAEFPSIDDLRTAYYKIEADLDLEATQDLNDYLLVQEYDGLGTSSNPFAGVITGAKMENGSYPTIVLPGQSENNTSQVNYGLIQYMQGAVVKDLNITTPAANDDDGENIFVKVTGYAGGVAAIVLGGDNIIDNVTTAVRFTAWNGNTYSSSTTVLGGYVGVIRNGSVILRNISDKNVIAGCEFKHINTANNAETYFKYDDAKTFLNDTNSLVGSLVNDLLLNSQVSSDYVGLLVGRVEDGFVLYEHNNTEKAFEDADKKVLQKEDLIVSDNSKNALALVNGFNLINGYALDQAVETHGKIDVTVDGEGNLAVDIKNGEELEIIALALNSDALSIYYDATENRAASHEIYGYNYTSKCRKADYSHVGTKNSDRDIAQTFDDGKNPDSSNIYLYPYLFYRYMNFDETGGAGVTEELDILKNNYNFYIDKSFVTETKTVSGIIYQTYSSKYNKIHDNVKSYTTTYQLNKDNTVTVFDVSGFGISFRGLGALYTVGKSDFRGNFNGNGKSVKIEMDRDFDAAKDFSTGMFNSLTYDTRIGETVGASTASSRTSTVSATVEITPLVIENFNIVDSIFRNTAGTGTFTGAVAGKVEGVWDFKDITVQVTSNTNQGVIDGKLYVGGLIGSVNLTKWQNGYNDNLHLSSNIINIQRCSVSGNKSSKLEIHSTSGTVAIGGIIGGLGRYPASNSNYDYYFGTVSIIDSKVSDTDISLGTGGNAGGIAGWVGYRRTDLNYSTVGIVTVSNTESYKDTNIERVSIKNTVSNSNAAESSIGGAFGKVQVANGSSYNGTYGYVTIDGFHVSELQITPSENITNLTYKQDNHTNETNSNHPSNNNGIGGVIGFNRTQYTDLFNICIEDSVIGTGDTSNLSTGGLIGYNQLVQYSSINKAVQTTVRTVEIKSSAVLSKTGRAGGYIGDLRTEINSFIDGKIEDCEIASQAEYVGGVVGYINPNMTGYTTTITNQQVLGTSVRTLDNSTNGSNTIAAGGIIGYVHNKNNIVTVGEIYVGQGCNIRGSKSGGGVFGIVTAGVNVKINGWIGIGAKYDADTDGWTEDTVFNNISGRISGGVTGCDDSTTARSISAHIYVSHSRIYSYDRMKNASGRCGSGGLAGYKYGASANVIYDDVTITNNIIITSGRCGDAENCYSNSTYMPAAGGLYGRLESNGSSVTHFPNVTLENNSIGFYDISGMEENDNKYASYQSLDIESDEVQLFYYDTDNKLKSVNWKEADMNESNVGRYSIGIGRFIGYTNSNRQVYILRPKVSYDDSVGSIPAVDVGNLAYVTATAAQYGTSYPYAYRNYVHIIYLSDAGTAANTVIDTSITDSIGEDEYFFSDLENIVADYKQVKHQVVDTSDSAAVKAATYQFLTSDRLNITMTSKDINYSLCDGDNNYYDDTYNRDEYNAVPVIVLDGQEVQHIGDYAALLLTNGGGAAQQSTMLTMKNNGVIDITCVNAVITPDGKIIRNDGSYGTGDNRTSTSIKCTNKYTLSLDDCPYDERIVKDNGDVYYTITLLQYTYGVKTTTGTYKETVYIPVYVKEKVTVRSTVRILSGEDYSYTNAKTEGKFGELVIAHGSLYTIFTEFTYDSIRLKEAFKDITVKKTLVFANSQEPIPKGTKLTLVDSQTGKDYYYTVGDEEINEIPFTAFTNDGTAYTERKIGTGDITLTANNYTMFDGTLIKEEVGIERYFIFVEPPEGDHNITFDFEVKAEPLDQNTNNMDGYFKKFLESEINMEFIPGPQISFAGVSKDSASGIYTGTKDITYTLGTISQEKTIDIDATIDISLADSTSPYWTKRDSTIDSTNNGKYMDIAVSLLDENGQEVSWPEGTNVIFNGGTPQIVSGSVLYLYKDSGKQLAYDSLERDVDGSRRWYYYSFYDSLTNEDKSKWITSDDGENYYYYEEQTEIIYLDNVSIDPLTALSNYTHLTFDFSLADVSEYAGNKYTVLLKMYRSTDPEYPIEEEIEEKDNKYTEYKEEIYGEYNREMGAAVSVIDTMDLGINVYNNFNTEETISFTNKFDFTNIINTRNQEKAEEDIAGCAASEYMVTYRIQKKNTDGKYVTIDWSDSPFKLSQLTENENGEEVLTNMTIMGMNGQEVYVEYKKFTSEDIKTGVNGVPYVTSWDMRITADMDQIKDNETDWTNYKLVITYLPYDPAADTPANDENAALTDYFIFTIAKLKTDM